MSAFPLSRPLLAGLSAALSAVLLLPLHPRAQALSSYFVSSAAPSADNNPSVLRRLEPTGQLTVLGTVTANGAGVVVNGLGCDPADPYHAYAMELLDEGVVAPPTFYKISLVDASAVALGTITPPTAPRTTFPNLGLSFVLPQLGEGASGSRFFLAGGSANYNFFTGAVTNIKFYAGTLNLNIPPPAAIPVWRQITPGNASTQAFITTYLTACVRSIAEGTPVPTTGIQDWVFDPASGNLVSYLGQERQFFTLTNPAGAAPTAFVTTPAAPLPAPTTIGYMYRDIANNLFGVSNETGTAYHFDRTTGNFLDAPAFPGLGATQGDAATGTAVPVPLPVTLTEFAAAPAGAATVQVRWTTATEAHVAYFEVQRSAEAGTKWETVGRQPAANAAGRSYHLTDFAPLNGPSYYRLATTDEDGRVAYSPVKAVRRNAPAEPLVVTAYPNPNDGRFTLAFSAPAPAGSAVALRDGLGRTVWQADLSQQQHLDVVLPALPSGVYYLSTTGEGYAQTQRLTVQ